MLRGSWQMGLVVVGIRPLVAPGVVAVPIGDRTPTGVAVSGIATTLSPGTMLVDVDWAARTMLIHAMDASDPARVIAAHQHFYDRWQRHVFP
jgi:multisubunit Na+/H+ antiporter MnhE subunit